MTIDECLACQILNGEIVPPGGIIYENQTWLVDHVLPPIFLIGSLTLKLKRHCEHLAELTAEESKSLGPLIQQVSEAVQMVTEAEKVHVASYGEGVKHIHFLITPRTAGLPASNIYLTFWLFWRRIFYASGFRIGMSTESDAAACAALVRQWLSTKNKS